MPESTEWIQVVSKDESFNDKDFSGIDFIQCRFSRCSFRYTNLSDILTKHCRFDNFDFTGAQFNGSTHHTTSFANSIFSMANFFWCNAEKLPNAGSKSKQYKYTMY